MLKRESFSIVTACIIDRLYTSRSEGGRELVQQELSYKLTTIGLQRYLETTEDCMMIRVKEYERNKKLYLVIKEANKFRREFQVGEEVKIKHNTPTAAAKNLKNESKCNVPNAETMAR